MSTTGNKTPRLSVIIPTRNRHDRLRRVVEALSTQELAPAYYEIIVVDDGSTPPVKPAPHCQLVRLDGLERSVARNSGARRAQGQLLVFVDDDIIVEPGFLTAHLRAHDQYTEALVVGAVVLPGATSSFMQFRRSLETASQPQQSGVVERRNFCSANNMSLSRKRFAALGGFDERLVTAEDQDLALRHSAQGGAIVFFPEACGLHDDDVTDIATYCRRFEQASRTLVRFCRLHPALQENQERHRINGALDWQQDGLARIVGKALKSMLSVPTFYQALLYLCSLIERHAPPGPLTFALFRFTLGISIFRGYRRGLLEPFAAIDSANDAQRALLGL